MKCNGCSYLKIGYDENESELAKAICTATPRGRCLTWAYTTYISTEHGFEVSEFGTDRVDGFMEDRNAPKWCPLRGAITNEM